jgi:hypothetical protein
MSITFSSASLAGTLTLLSLDGIEVRVKIFANYLCPIVRKGLCVNAIILRTERIVTS